MQSNCSSLGLLVILLIYTLNAAVINLKKGDKCSTTCSGKENIFKYEEKKIYIYNFLSKHSIKNPNSKEETLQLELQGKAQLSKISGCDFGLLLSDVKLKEFIKENPTISKEYGMMKTLLEKYPLRFGYDNGRVTGLCQDNMDNDFAVNIKRGILSSLQVSLDSLDTPNYLTETDIAGDCITEYSTQSEPPNFVLVTKKKSIAGCSRKTKYFTTISGRVHEQPKESRNLALLDGSYNCEIKIKRTEGLKESICQETHTFKPLQSDKEGSQILINQELRFDSMKDGNIDTKIPTTRSDLIMKHGDKTPIFMKEKLNDPKIVLQEVCTLFKENAISSKVTELFLSLIRSLSGSSYENIKALYKEIEDNAVCNPNKIKIRNLLVDVLSNVKSDAAFKFLIEDVKIYKFSKLGFSIFDNPTSTMIATLTNSLTDSNSYDTLSTILSTMIKSHCETTPGCMLNPDVIKAMEQLTNQLGKNCKSFNKESKSKILYSLRALSNAGSHPNIDSIISTIKSCVLSRSDDDDVRVYSSQVFRQYSCNENVDNFLWTIFDDVSYNAEVRIESYLSLIRCPTRSMFGQIIQKLRNEQSQQLGSFIWSHISNLMESADRFKTDIRDMLQIYTKPMNELEKKFNLDFRSYSKNIEKTYQRGYSAAKIDTNIIFSSSSPIPSSVNINTTFEIFGRSINLFEIGVREKGISKLIFGSQWKPNPHENPHPDVVKMSQKIPKKSDILSISLYSRIMGREVYFNPNLFADVSKIIVMPSTKFSFERSLLILDTTVSVASITGFPVELQIESAASVNFNVMRNKKIQFSDIELSAMSKYAIQITGKLLVNSHCTKIGIQSKGVISKDIEFGGKLKLQRKFNPDESNYQFELNKIPDNSKLFSISNELTLIHKLDKVKTIDNYNIKLEKCSGEGVMKIMGLKICLLYKESPTFSTFLPNIKAEVRFEKFSGLKLLWKKESAVKPIQKLKSLLISASFPGAEEDTFRLSINRDPSIKRQTYEILLWKKLSYIKFDINDKVITGELKSGTTMATLSGKIENKGIFTSEMNVDIKSNTNSGKLYFFQKFTKDGPEIVLKLTKDGENGFDLSSKTNLRLTQHKLYNYFQRFRHSTNLKYSGENEMSLVLESSKANKPLTESKSKVEIFWQTKMKRNFYINQAFFWQNVADIDKSELFGSVTGTRFIVKLDHGIEVKDKKFNVTNNFAYFLSDNFLSFEPKPMIFMIMFKREDVIKKETLFEASNRFGLDLSNMNDGKIIIENLINYPAMKINRKLNSKVTWKQNQLGMYDIDAEYKGTILQLYFKHKFTDTQNGNTIAELKIGEISYKINSRLNLPTGHSLMITWPENNIEMDSKVDLKSTNPIDLIINHELKMNSKLLAKIKNSLKYNNELKEIMLSSNGITSEGRDIFFINFHRKFKYDYSATRFFYDYNSILTITVPNINYDKQLSIEQFADINLDGKIELKTDTFKSKVTLKNLAKDKPMTQYGYEINVNGVKDAIPYNQVNVIFYNGLLQDEILLQCGIKGYNFLIGISLNFKETIVTNIIYKFTVEKKIAQNSFTFLLDLKESSKYNFYLKRDITLNWATENAISLKWKGEYGIYKMKRKPFSGLLKASYKGFKEVYFNIDIKDSIINPCLANANFNFRYNFEEKTSGTYLLTLINIIKWQNKGSQTANYYDLQMNANLDILMKKFKFNFFLIKDSKLKKIIEIKAISNKGESLEVTIKVGENFAKLIVTTKVNENSNRESKLLLTTSNELLKELTVRLENKLNSKTQSILWNVALNTQSDNYKLTVSKLQKKDFQGKIDLVEQLNWTSNIPYILSGSGLFGILLQGKIFQCNLNLLYQQAKVIDLKIETSDITKNLNFLISSRFTSSYKFQTKYERDDNNLKFELDSVYNDKFFKIQQMELSYKLNGKVFYSSVNIIIKTSKKDYEEITFFSNVTVDLENILKTFKRKAEIKLNGKVIETSNIDLETGIIYLKSSCGKYIKVLNFETVEINSGFKFESIRNFMIEYKSVFDEKPLTELNLSYFRAKESEESKKIDTLGEAMFYLDMRYNRQGCSGKITVFIDKSKQNAIVKMQANMPLIELKLDEVSMVFGSIKGSDNVFTGNVKYKGNQYTFTYERSVGYKRKLKITAKDKSSKPQEINFNFDFNKDYIFHFSFDEYFNIDVILKSTESNSYSGTIKFLYKTNEIINLSTNSKIVIPPDVSTTYSYIKTFFGIQSGLDLSLEIDGRIMKIPLKSKLAISHFNSKKLSGGIQSITNFNLEVNENEKVRKFFIKKIFDRNWPQFYLDQEVTMLENENIVLKRLSKVYFISWKDIHIEHKVVSNNVDYDFAIINNENMVKANINYKIYNKNSGVGFTFIKKTVEIFLYQCKENINVTLETNFGYFVLLYFSKKNSYSIEEQYYIKSKIGIRSYEVQLIKKSETIFEIKYNVEDEKSFTKVIFSTINEWKAQNKLSFVLKGETSIEEMKYFTLKSDVKFTKELMILKSNLNVNKNNRADLELKIKSNNGKSPYALDIKYKGSYIITVKATLDLKKAKFSHNVDVKDKQFKTPMWSCFSNCEIKPKIDCFYNHINKARDIKVGITWTKALKLLEFSWNKRKERGFIYMLEKEGKNTKMIVSSPIRTVKITKIKKEERRQFTVEIIRKADPNKPVTFSLDYLMKGSLKTDYNLDIQINSNLLHKGLLISINRQVSMNIGDIYTLNIKAKFENELKPFFTLEGYLRQLSSRSYEMMLNVTSSDKYLALTTRTSFTYEELSFEYKIDEKNEKSKEFIFKFIPFTKFLITNNADFKILMSRAVYQYGYRRDIIIKLGKTGPNIVSYATLIKSPFKYYAEASGNGKKMVVHFRPVGNSFIGEVYRKVDGYKFLDISLKAGIDSNNILNSNLYWNPKFIEDVKECVRTVFQPDNIRTLLVNSYEISDNQFSSFTSNIKMDLIKKVNVVKGLDFAKNVENDLEQIPNAFAETYDDDNLYMKYFMTSAYKYLKSINFQENFSQRQNKVRKYVMVVNNQIYEWFINAKIYSSIYDFINNNIGTITYDQIKYQIEGLVYCGKVVASMINSQITTIGNRLNSLSERVRSVSILTSNIAQNLISAYEGSKVNEMIILLREIRREVLNELNQLVETEFIKQRVTYYKESIENIKDFIKIILEMKTQILNKFKSSSLFGTIVETIKLIRTMKYKEAFLNMIKPEEAKFEMNLDKATMNMTMFVPHIVKPMLKTWKTVSDWFPAQILSQLRGTGFNNKLLALFYRYEYIVFNYGSLKSLQKLLPPFKKTAWILNGNSILTYDGSSIRIGEGKCSYLLARDMKQGSFSLVMNIKSDEKEKTFVLSYIKIVKILSSGTIKVDGLDIKTLPQLISSKGKSIEIYRDDDTIKIKTSEGLTIEYFVNLDYLKVSLQGYWHGKVMGLLGSNDFEIINDWSIPNGRITHDAGILSKSWSIENCKSETKTGLFTIRVDTNQLQGCVNHFKRDSMSYLTRCFSLIDPEPYFELCRLSLQYKKMTQKQFNNLICDLSRNYVMRCKSKGIMIRLQKSCITCGSMKLTGLESEISLKKNIKFNFIFIIEQSKCLAPYKKLIEDLLDIIALQKDNLYTLMSFNGKSIFKSAHFKSLNNEINTDSNGFKILLNELKSPLQIRDVPYINSSAEGSQAIYDAIKMPSKLGYIEKIIFVSCSACAENKKYSFSILAGMLEKAGISLTYLTTKSFTGQGVTSDTVGLGNKLVHYFEKDSLKMRTWKMDLQPPNDVCSSLAGLKNGFVWSLNPVTSKMRSRRIAEKLHTELINVTGNPKQKCVCGTGNYEDGKIECKVRGLK